MEVKKKLLNVVRDKIRFKHYIISTERTYIHSIKHYIFFHHKKHSIEMGKIQIEEFLTYLAVKKLVAPTTQKQAFLEIDVTNENIQALIAQERKAH